jgi:hypothetical protein
MPCFAAVQYEPGTVLFLNLGSVIPKSGQCYSEIEPVLYGGEEVLFLY